MERILQEQRGFTLVEFLLYIAIVSVVLSVAGATSLNILFGKAKLSALEEVSQNARFSLNKISKSVADASGIISPPQASSSPTLSLQVSDLSKNPTVFSVSNGILQMKEGSASSSDLVSSKVEIFELRFSNITSTSTPGTVKIRMKIRAANPGKRPEYDFEQIFYATSNVRKN